MKHLLRILAALSLAMPLSAQAATMVFANKSSKEIHGVYFWPFTQSEWGEDRLGSAILEHGDSLVMSDVEHGAWNVMLVDEDGDQCIVVSLPILGDDRWDITDKDLLHCQANT